MTPTPTSNDGQFDFIIVGSGAGGGPLAARLAREKFRVLVIEAGSDHHAAGGEAQEVSLVPGLHAVSTEHKALSWRFWVKHYDKPPTGKDPKCHPKTGKIPPPEGIFYPRAAGLGGCTVHNAMITIAGPDADWEDLADFLGDDSWRGAPMRAYFQKLERNEYHRPPKPVPTRWWGRLWAILRWVFGFTPDHTRGRHGFEGWLHTSVTDFRLGLGDKQLVRMLKGALRQVRRDRLDRGWTWVRRFLNGAAGAGLDPNHSRTQAESPEGIAIVPLAVCGSRTTIHQNGGAPHVMRGRRSSPREFLLETKQSHPEYLTIWTDVLVTRVLFTEGEAQPRAIGVSFLKGRNLYQAHPVEDDERDRPVPGTVFVQPRGEVILCGGAFNTPQLLMLSGLGDRGHLETVAGNDVQACALQGRNGQQVRTAEGASRIHLPGVGRNLQDRYEVTVISKMRRKFSLLDDATFKLPGAGSPDRHLKEWRDAGTGLYTSNGAVLGILKRSNRFLEQPDLFIFGIPLPFYGYDLGYSGAEERDEFTWAILKGKTRNADGTVRLRTPDPRDTPDINFHYFNEITCPRDGDDDPGDRDPDLLALVDGVKFVRGIARRANRFWRTVVEEKHPGLQAVPEDDEQAIRNWIRQQAWGHHACGTCRMGPKDDPNAVLDSRFRVRGVDGLRVVDASIFPRIPGYFIVTNIYMASEKAADVIAADRRGGAESLIYPQALRAKEAAAIAERRQAVPGAPDFPPPDRVATWPGDVTGLALSGGGIRSATFNLGVLQALARRGWLRQVDFMSTVSGGGYIGTFLGRWFDRLRPQSKFGGTDRHPNLSAVDEIEQELNNPRSSVLFWLRRHGNYIAPGGRGDRQVNSAVFIRNFLSVHFVIGVLLLTIFGGANFIRYAALETGTGALEFLGMTPSDLPIGRLLVALLGVFYSPWFLVFEGVLLFMFVPRIVAYWIVSQKNHERYEPVGLAALLVISGALLYAAVRQGLNLPILLLAVAPLLAIVYVEMAWKRGHDREEAIGSGNAETQRLRTRNYLTYDLGLALALAGGAAGFALIDTIGHAAQQYAADNRVYIGAVASFVAAVTALAPMIRLIANLFAGEEKKGSALSALPRPSRAQIMAGVIAAVMFAIPLVFVSFLAHLAYDGGPAVVQGLAVTVLALILSGIFAHRSALTFVNRSSLAQTYAARLARAYLGATNPVRFRPHAANVTEVVAGDDVAAIDQYRPYKMGGPLHLLNLTVNQTVDFSSQRGNRDRQGENLAVSSLGLSVGKWWHSAWAERQDSDREKRPVGIVPLGHVRGTDHPLVDEQGNPARGVEMLSLRQWMGVSGAAVGPGRGQTTKLGTALLFGLANLRTGHWWDSSLPGFARDGLPPLTFLRRVGYLLRFFFQMQALLLSEWIARFPGPWDRFWYLSDGGFFEVLGTYELIRRRVPRIIVSDASADPTYELDSFANLVRKARIDFDAEIVPVDYTKIDLPDDVRKQLGTLEDLRAEIDANGKVVGPSRKHAALFWVDYGRGSDRVRGSVLLYVKATLTGDEGADVAHYSRTHQQFPHEPTADQFFDEMQWESYRRLGEHILTPFCENGDWFWNIPLETELP